MGYSRSVFLDSGLSVLEYVHFGYAPNLQQSLHRCLEMLHPMSQGFYQLILPIDAVLNFDHLVCEHAHRHVYPVLSVHASGFFGRELVFGVPLDLIVHTAQNSRTSKLQPPNMQATSLVIVTPETLYEGWKVFVAHTSLRMDLFVAHKYCEALRVLKCASSPHHESK